MIRALPKPVVIAAALSVAHAARPMTAQTPAPEVALGFGVDTAATDVGPIVRLLRAYLAAPEPAAHSRDLWRTGAAGDHTHDDLAARYALQGFPATVIGVVPTDDADTVYTVKLLHARAERAGGPASPIALERLYAIRAPQSRFGWMLGAALPRLTKNWPVHKVGRITFHYAPGQVLDKRRANAAALFVDSVAALFVVRPPAHIDHYVTASPDEYFRALGLDFFVSASGPGESAGGNALPDVGVLLTGDPRQGELYRHELVHIALGGRIRSGFINEGVAAWLGGSRRQAVHQLYRGLASFQQAHPEVTFTAILRYKLSIPHEPVASSDAWYASGALACDAVYHRAGVTGLRALADTPPDVDAVQRVLAHLLGIADEPDALDRWWRTTAAAASRPGYDRSTRSFRGDRPTPF